MAVYFWETRSEKWLVGNGRIGYKIVQGRTTYAAAMRAEKRGESARRQDEKGVFASGGDVVGRYSSFGQGTSGGDDCIRELGGVRVAGDEEQKRDNGSAMPGEYVVRTETTEYHVRQEKAAKQEMIPVNTSIEFTLDKDKMKFKANGKKYEYIVVSESAVTAAKP
jgi:hypothetical protein